MDNIKRTEIDNKTIKIGNSYKKVIIKSTFNDEIDINDYFRKMIIRKLEES